MAFRTLVENQQLSNTIVVDNSVMMRWLFNGGSEKDQQYAQSIRTCITKEKPQVVTPYIWVYEASFVTNYYTKKGIISVKESKKHLHFLFDLCSVIRGEEKPKTLFEFANENGLSSYDSSYVMLALQLECPLATLDKGIIRNADSLGFDVF